MVMKRPALEMSDDHSRRSDLDYRTILQFKIVDVVLGAVLLVWISTGVEDS